jgi:hypothetical protein
VIASRGQRATIERRAAAASSSNRQQARSSGTQRACCSSRHQRTGRQHTHSFPKIENWDRLCVRGRQLFTRANIYVSDLGDLAVPMRPASGSRGLRAPHLAAITRRSPVLVVVRAVVLPTAAHVKSRPQNWHRCDSRCSNNSTVSPSSAQMRCRIP